jgi:hypothetical protein
MASIKVFDSIEKLKADRIERIQTKEEKVRQKRAAESLKNIKRKPNSSSLEG